ncbi:UsfY protein [Mycobacterium intracellulare]|uniref:UsfY protein n=1 Tax=Mycobacterium intracellulare TaxID=1767 RepID=A0AAE4RES4_MYCIT|nr:UsfY protein [Mycobacterium intracellulare]MDV6978771.1 UsfY protein [Mycobacterium intracellulare]MDV6984077.1 UsfY protein [Mycobacterium intracellulare]MDV7014491.1 UsfY protein [Mycobacterium intracellulare]MDV7030002.1 UsfY protein [Mycobacterium intracellulare]
MKDNFFWPGFILLGVALCGIIASLAVAAYQHYEWLSTVAIIALLATVAATLWFVVELRRVTLLENQRLVTGRADPVGAPAISGQQAGP